METECKHTIKSGKFAGQRCKNNAHHDGFCWKHKKVVVPKNIMDEVVGKAPAAENKPKPQYKFSTFRWTVNSNTSATKMTPEQIREFKRLVEFLLNKDNVIEYLVDRTAPNPKTNLVELDELHHFEVGPKTHAVHAHGVIKLKHTGNYIINLDVINEILAGVLGKKVHFNVKASGDPDRAWDQYIEKQQSAEKI